MIFNLQKVVVPINISLNNILNKDINDDALDVNDISDSIDIPDAIDITMHEIFIENNSNNINYIKNNDTNNDTNKEVIIEKLNKDLLRYKEDILCYKEDIDNRILEKLDLINQLGQVVKVISLNETNNHQANITNVANGIYFIVGKGTNGSINQKVIVNK